jgi:hypothetical protein
MSLSNHKLCHLAGLYFSSFIIYDINMAGAEAYLPLLRMSIGLQQDGAAAPAKEMEAERKEWLKEAMANILRNPVDDMKDILQKLKAAESDEDKTKALDSLVAYVEDIDLARDLHKIGGLSDVVSLLDHPSSQVRASAAHVVGAAVHNNPEPQKWAMEMGALEALARNLNRTDASSHELNKAIYGVSGLIRQNDLGTIRYIKELKGFALLVSVMKRQDDEEKVLPVQRRAVFLLFYLVNRAPAVLPATAAHVVPVVAEALTKHSDDPDLRENAVQVLQVYQSSERVTLDSTLKGTIVKSTTIALESAKKDDHDTVVTMCEELLGAIEVA